MTTSASNLKSAISTRFWPAPSEEGRHHIRETAGGQFTADQFTGRVAPRRQPRREAAERAGLSG